MAEKKCNYQDIEKESIGRDYLKYSDNFILKIKKDFFSFKEALRIPSNPDLVKPGEKPKEAKPVPVKGRAKILSPLEEVFFETELMDDLIIRTSIPQLLDRQVPVYPGVILFGPPGTGKSEFQKAVCRVYDNAGAYAKQVSTSAVNSCFVGEFAKNLERELQTANEQGEIRGLASFLSFDEGSILAEQAKQGASSVSKHYQEAIDTLKRYLGNDCGKWLVLAISTNQLPEDFEEAMIREGRLTSFLISYPSQKQIAGMWKHFALKYNVIKLNEENAKDISQLTESVRGSLIEQFCRGYLSQRRQEILVAKGHSGMLEALKSGQNITDDEVRKTITYEQFRNDINDYLRKSEERNGTKEEPLEIGFHTLRKGEAE